MVVVSRIRDYILRYTNSDCLVCYLRPALYGCKFVMPIAFSCPHFNKTTSPKFTQSNVFKHLAYCLCMMMFLTCSVDIFLLVSGTPQYGNANLAVNDMLMCFGVCLALLTGTLTLKHKIEELNGLVAILHNRKQFCIGSFLNKKLTMKSYLACNAVVVFLVLGSFTNVITSCYQLGYNDFAHILKRIVTELCTYVQACHTLHMALMTITYTMFIKKCHKRIKVELMFSLNTQNRRSVALMKLSRLHLALTENFNRANSFSGPIYVIIWTLLILLLINNFYVFVCSYMNDGLREKLYDVLKLKVAFNCIACAGFLFLQQSVTDLNRKMVAFLHRFSTAKMTWDETRQIEILVMILDVQRPVVSVLSLFTVGVRLVPALAGTVITYLLVALQFYVASLKKPRT